MTEFDYVVLAVVGISLMVGMMRGFAREVLMSAGWVVAYLVAQRYSTELAPLLPPAIPTESLRILAAFVILFASTLLISSLLAIALSEIFKRVGLGWLDRSLGALFGLARGLLIVCILVLLAGMTRLPQDVRWRDAMFSAPLEALANQLLVLMPSGITEYVKF